MITLAGIWHKERSRAVLGEEKRDISGMGVSMLHATEPFRVTSIVPRLGVKIEQVAEKRVFWD